MSDNGTLRLHPAEVSDVSTKLDELTSRLEELMQTEKSNLTVTPAGRDEVSQVVASTLNEVHAAFTKSSETGITEIREIAATMRAHNGDLAAADQSFNV